MVPCVVTGTSGRFAFDAVGIEGAEIVASAFGLLPARQALSDGRSLAAAKEVILTLDAGGVVVTGRVLDATGGSIAGALVSAHAKAGGPMFGAVTSSTEGQFELAVPAGAVTLHARADAYSQSDLNVQAPLRGVILVLTPASSIAGVVVTDGAREPIADAWVIASNSLDPTAPPRHVRTDESGRFRVTELSGGRYDVAASSARWRSPATPVQIGVGEAAEDVVLTVSRGTTLDGIVNIAGVPCAYGAVELGGPVRMTEPIRNGSVHFDGLWAGRYLAMIACSTAAAQSEDMTVTAGAEDQFLVDGEPVTRDWNLSKADTEDAAGTIQVVIDADGNDPMQFTASVLKDGSPHVTSGRRDGDRFVFEQLSLGRYDAFLEQSPESAVPVILTRDAPQREVHLRTPKAATISGQLLDASHNPVADAWVRAYHREYRLPELSAAGAPALTGPEGHFTIVGLVAGEYDIRADSALGQARLERVNGGSTRIELRLGSADALP
ncbi:MAG TPA: carboxypeptidase-like regulatory domain-containing protein [Polyangiaceae bacterium]|nr:carboxypeptidase-like regulatory domain-containing protein [Polyangiaceae bacterium]